MAELAIYDREDLKERRVAAWIAAEGERRVLWLPVCFGLGIALYFALTVEPPGWIGTGVALATGAAAFLLRRWPAAGAAMLAL
ncbi:MAG TPA: hypothetical protein VFW46_12640, partial [Stellaceae bacterium]|nr:hypothetical protein [Stellaceae bacterium]